jgi:hypothetical protein
MFAATNKTCRAGAVAAAIAAVLLAGCSGGSRAADPPGAQGATTTTTSPRVTTTTKPEPILRSVPVGSTYETATRSVSRDGGISVALPDGRALWLFGDTGIYERTPGGPWNETKFIDGSTAMMTRFTRGAVPSGSELPFAEPARFLPVPDDVYLPDGSGQPCNSDTAAFAARWPVGATLFDADHAIVTYSIDCVTSTNGVASVQAEGWGYVLYNWHTGQFDAGPTDVFLPAPSGALYPPARVYVSPQVANGRITFYSMECTKPVVTCLEGQVWSTTMPATLAAMSDPASYQTTPLATDGKTAWTPLSVSVGRYGEGLRLVELTGITGGYRIFTAPKAEGPWHLARTGALPGCPSPTGYCIALEGHPELSTATRTFVSYKQPDVEPGGHVVVSSLPT